MPLLTGAMSARRYSVIAEFEDAGLRDKLLDRLAEEAFREPLSAAKGGENYGWVTLENLCDVDFSASKVLFNQYVCFSLRIDNKRLPGKLVKALLDLRVRAWLKESGRERVPGPVKKEMLEQIELELYPRQLPAVSVHDICWDLGAKKVWFFSNSNKANELFRTLFAKTFLAETRPIGPLQLIATSEQAETWVPALDRIGYADYRPSRRGDAR
ncbi:MAG: recombination-associated protein RdgC [Deltaproteobacteria bacterium]|nr:recombination-associated protein RdgC [Deltaproteobacteria bacterium]